MSKFTHKSGIAHTFETIDRNFIVKGDKMALDGWALAANECIALCNGKASTYAQALVTDRLIPAEKFNTTRQYIGAVVKVLQGKILKGNGQAFKVAEFVNITQVVDTVAGAGQRANTVKPVRTDVERIVSSATKLSNAEIRKIIRELEAALTLTSAQRKAA